MNYDSHQFLHKPNWPFQKHGRVSFKYILIPNEILFFGSVKGPYYATFQHRIRK